MTPSENPDAAALAELEAMLAASEARLAIQAAGGSAKLLLPVVLPQLAVRREGGRVRIAVVGEDGRERVANTGAPLTVAQFVLELKQDKELAGAFLPERPAARRPREDAETWGPGRPITLTRAQARDVPTYRHAKAEAEKLGVQLILEQKEAPVAVPPGALVLSREAAKDPATYQAAKAQAAAEGREFKIAQTSPAARRNSFFISRADARDPKLYAAAKARAQAAGGTLVLEQP